MSLKPVLWKRIIAVTVSFFILLPLNSISAAQSNFDTRIPSVSQLGDQGADLPDQYSLSQKNFRANEHKNLLAGRNALVFPSNSIELAKVINPVPDRNGYFGGSIDSSGHLVIIGAQSNDIFKVNPIRNAGAAYIYQCGEKWNYECALIAALQSPDPQESDHFGFSVGISGDTAIVSGPENGATGDLRNNAGAVYVFERNQGGPDAWGLASILRASDSAPDDVFGSSISIDGDWIIASAAWENGGEGDPLPDSGAVYVFHRSSITPNLWNEVSILRASDAEPYDYFGENVALSGETAVIGARLENGGSGGPLPESGSAYIFQRTGLEFSDWNQIAILQASDRQTDDWFGQFVEIDGNYVAVTASSEDGGALNYPRDSGAVYLFHRNNGGANRWGEFAILRAPDAQSYQSFGSALAIKDQLVFIGSPGNDEFDGQYTSNPGAVYVYRIESGGLGNVRLIEKITHASFQVDDLLGTSVSFSDGIVSTGAAGMGSDPQNTVPHAGAVLFFKLFPYSTYLPVIYKQ